jgi:DEAD/DEAH box helicase domain-containing protein
MELLIEEFLHRLRVDSSYKKQIVHKHVMPVQNPQFGTLDRDLPEILQKYLLKNNIRLFCHQAEAINKIRKNQNVVIVTPTASGKTLTFNLPVFETMLSDKNATSLYLYPTKALTNDQLKVIKDMEVQTGIKVNSNIYDGDTPKHLRSAIRKKSRIVLSNPYGIHYYLPWHYKWRHFLQNLKYIIIDEAHVYRGVFGSNVAMLIRRLLRICKYYNSNPGIILSSATIANPKEHAEKLTSKKFEVVSKDGAPKGAKTFIFWNPPYIDDNKSARRSTHQETKDLLVQNVLNDLQTLCFTTSRQMAELVTRWTKEELYQRSPLLSKKVTAYRAGYLPSERRTIENNLKNKNLVGVVSTNALELGIDVGTLDSILISGYPGSIISTWQQAGRAGRNTKESLVTMIAFQNPLDQYFMNNPQDFFEKNLEKAIIDLHNPYITLGHVMCASSELPLKEIDIEFFPELFVHSLQSLEKQNIIQKTQKGYAYSGLARPTEVVNLKSISGKNVTVMYNGKILETLSLNKAYDEAYQGAVLLHQAETYIVEELSLKTLIAKVRKEDVNYHTHSKKTVDVTISQRIQEKGLEPKIGLGQLTVTEFYHEYIMKTYDQIIGRGSIDLPPITFSTIGLWILIPNEIGEMLGDRGLNFEGGLHAAEHAMIGMAPLFAMCDRRDIGGLSTTIHPDTGCSTIFIYDGFEGGIGISEALYSKIDQLLVKTLNLIKNCECENGCPSCIYSPRCGNENEPLDKKAALIILEKLTNMLSV